jgi:opacity protein-like surface antigen
VRRTAGLDQTLIEGGIVNFDLMRQYVVASAVIAFAIPSVSGAQMSLRSAPRMEAGAAFEYAQPIGDFRQNVRQGFGGAGHFVLGLDSQSIIGIRVDAGFINYGNDTHYVPFSSSVRRIIVREETSNNIFVASIGPQLTLPIGRVRPYVNGGIGVAYFYTQTSLDTDDDTQQIAQTTNYSDNSLTYTGGAGFNIPLTSGSSPISLDVGARYNSIASARYLTKGDIMDDPNSQFGIIITPHETPADFIAYHLGVSFRF